MRTSALIGLIVVIALTVFVSPARAQRGGFSPEAMMDRLDQDGNGRIDEDELSETRLPLADMAEQAGIDTSRGLDEDDLERVFEQMQRSREEGGGRGFGGFGGDRGGFGGDRGGFDGGRGGFDRGGFGGDRGGSDRGGRGGFERGGRGGFDRGSRGGDRSGNEKQPPPRVTIDLQSEYVAGDTNKDGQIAMSEWLRWKSRASLAEFLSLDLNGDGMLTPRELSNAARAQPVNIAARFPSLDPSALGPATGAPVARPTPTTPQPLASSSSTSTSTASAVPTPSPADADRYAETAKRFFKILDRDQDGSITQLEWSRSTSLRPKFEGAGADLTQPMSEDQFVSYFVKFSTAGKST